MERAESGQQHERGGQHRVASSWRRCAESRAAQNAAREHGGQVRDEAGVVRGRLAIEAEPSRSERSAAEGEPEREEPARHPAFRQADRAGQQEPREERPEREARAPVSAG